MKYFVCIYLHHHADNSAVNGLAQNNAICHTCMISSLCRSSHQFTPLHIAAKYGHAEIAALLVQADAPLEAEDICCVSTYFVSCAIGMKV